MVIIVKYLVKFMFWSTHQTCDVICLVVAHCSLLLGELLLRVIAGLVSTHGAKTNGT